MSLVAFSSSHRAPHDELHPFERFAVRLSSVFSSLLADDVEDALSRALAEIGGTFAVDECTLVAYAHGGPATVVASWAQPPHPPCTNEDLSRMSWLLTRLARNDVVATTPGMDLPRSAAQDQEHAQRTGVVARLAVPVALGTRVVYGLMVGSRDSHMEWRVPTVERLRLVGEILGGGLMRRQQDEVLRTGEAPADSRTTADEAVPSAIVGESASLRHAVARLQQVAPLDATVLLLGETGTGKELFARALHNKSRRRDRMLIRVNCAALPPSLIESELFGHERGAFTGAVSMRQGRFELADGGTIFLDEIGDLAPELQAKLLRVLQEGEFERVGSSKTRRVDVRVIAATHMDLEKAVAEGGFRADLYYRLTVFPITLPALRERPQDVLQLVWLFIRRYQRQLGRRILQVPDDVLRALQHHSWPGNVRELENVIQRALIRSEGDTLQLDGTLTSDTRVEISTPREETLDAVQRSHIEKVLRECGWRINGTGNAAFRLGMHPNTLRFRIKKLGVVIPRRGAGATPPSATHPE